MSRSPQRRERVPRRTEAPGLGSVGMAQRRLSPGFRPELRHLRVPVPIDFPEEAEMPEGYAHLVQRQFLFQLLQFSLGPEHSVGSNQFVYWIANDPKRTLAPDVFVRLGVAQTVFGSWKTWEHGGAPDLAVEIVSPHETDGLRWDTKVQRYHELGVVELVRFDPEAREGERLRVWDRLRDDLVEREVAGDRAPCVTLGLAWTVRPIENLPAGLRLVDDAGRLLETQVEAEARGRAEEAQARADEARARAEEERRREAAEARVRELEALLARRTGG